MACLGSGPPQKSRRLRFRFSNTVEEEPVKRSEKVSSDDILDSLRKQSEDRLEESSDLEEVIIDEDAEQAAILDVVPVPRDRIGDRKVSHYRAGFVLIVFGALLVVGLYEYMTRLSDQFSLSRIVQTLNVRSIFGDLLQVSVISLVGVVAIGWITHRRRKHFQMISPNK